jgi:hypothetical protein
MAVESAADRAQFVSANDFGRSFRYLPGVGPEISVTGIFDAAYLLLEAGQAGVSGTAPTLLCCSSDLDALPAGKACEDDRVIDGLVQYRVVDVQPDGTGMSLLILERTA